MQQEGFETTTGRFLVIGCGSIGKRHLSNLLNLNVQKIAAFDTRPDRLEEVQREFGVEIYDDLERAVDDGMKYALVCTPTNLHVENALVAAAAGCHLFIEKPLSDTVEGIDRLVNEVRMQGLLTLIGCNYRFHPGLRFVRRLIENGSVGTIVSARAQFGQYLPDWRPLEDYRETYSARADMGGGVVLDRIHEIDYMRWLLGEVKEVFSITSKLSDLEIDVEDTSEILLRFESGTIGSIHLDYVRSRYECRLDLIGDKGTVMWDYQNSLVEWHVRGEESLKREVWPEYQGNTMYVDEMRHFIRVISGTEPSELDIEGGKRILEIALAVKESSRSNQPITL